MNPQIMQMLMQMLQSRGGTPQQSPGMGSLPFPRPGMPSPGGADPNQMNSFIMSLLSGGGMGTPGMGMGMGAPGVPGMGMGAGLARLPVMPRTGGVSPVASLVRNHFANQPQVPQGGGQRPMNMFQR